MAFLALFFLLWIIKLAVALFVASTKEVPVVNILSVIEKICFVKVYFVGIFWIFSPSPSPSKLLLTSQKYSRAEKNVHNARSALQRNLAHLAANQSAYYCSHIIIADIKIALIVWEEESDIPLRPARDHPFCHQSKSLLGLMINTLFYKKLKFNRSQVNSIEIWGYRCFLLGTVSFRFALLSFGRI